MASTSCGCIWAIRPRPFGIGWTLVVVDPTCAATHERVAS